MYAMRENPVPAKRDYMLKDLQDCTVATRATDPQSEQIRDVGGGW